MDAGAAADANAMEMTGETLDLISDLPRLTAREYRRGTVSAGLGEETAILLDAVSRDADVPLPVTVLTAWAAVLHRHSQQTGFLLGADPAVFIGNDEEHPAGDAMVLKESAVVRSGFVPVHVALRPAAPFHHELPRLRAAVTLALRSGEPERPTPFRAVLGGADTAAVRAAAPDVALCLERDTDGAATLSLHYNASLFTRPTAVWMLSHCLTLLAAAARKPALPVRDLPVLEPPGSDHTALDVDLPDGVAPNTAKPGTWTLPVPEGFVYPAPAEQGETLTARFRRTAAAQSERLAVTGASGSLSYAELNQLSHHTARQLRRFAGPDQRIALLCGHDIGAVVGVWSALAAGAAYVPLDPRQPNGRLGRLLADADVSALLCDHELADRAASLARGKRVIPIRLTSPAPGHVPDAAAGNPPSAEPMSKEQQGAASSQLAYLLHTSGSTGRPKAVAQTQGNVLAHALTYAARLRIGPGDQIPLLARYTSDAGVMDLYGALLTGATLHVTDPLLPAPQLRDRLAAVRATLVHCTPTLFRHLTGDLSDGPDSPDRSLCTAPPLPTVRAVVLGGEEATQQDLRAFLSAFPRHCSLINGLGPTECTLALQYRASRADLGGTVLPVGYPVEEVQVRLLDLEGQPTELRGELEIRSERVARGYWGQPDLTERVFGGGSDGPTSTYRTGDLLRLRADGALVFDGRTDRQIKIRGHRVEPGEVEMVLRGHPTVAEAVVTVDTEGMAPRLVGYVTPATALPPEPEELLGYLERALPEYAVPSRLHTLQELPLGPTGKLDRARLPIPDAAAAPDSEPATLVERVASAIWCRVLGLASAGLRSGFMASGGDSIRLLQLISAVRDSLGVEIEVVEFLASPNLASLAGLIERDLPGDTVSRQDLLEQTLHEAEM
ncbi:AMP-binding protein [Streptomyces uncialis]|uniref:AMP-binding protein n=1 Tax=Streptomyces uncialis TaxID=1048205 RepID=UPI0036666D39